MLPEPLATRRATPASCNARGRHAMRHRVVGVGKVSWGAVRLGGVVRIRLEFLGILMVFQRSSFGIHEEF